MNNRNEKIQIHMNKLAYLGLSVLELSKIVMYEFWYDYVKPKHGEKANLYYKDTGKADDIYKDIT